MMNNKFKYINLMYFICWFKGDRVVCMINNFGGIFVLEMSIIVKEVI